MTKWIEQLKKRKTAGSYDFTLGAMSEHIVFAAGDDQGVRRNGGRPGQSLGPRVIKFQASKMSMSQEKRETVGWIDLHHLGSSGDFIEGQNAQANSISQSLKQFSKEKKSLTHIGGGHDHVYPFLRAIAESSPGKSIRVFNFDAHLDTRTDNWAHSGTPFRQFDQWNHEVNGRPWELIQIGASKLSNTEANYKALSSGKMTILEDDRLFRFENYNMQGPETLNIFSLDCDLIDQRDMGAVSAPNPQGPSFERVSMWLEDFLKMNTNSPHYIGIYEYNPLFDDLSAKSARRICRLLAQTWDAK